nr:MULTISPECIES: hypothetical protein [unclassified Lysobacter]
MDIADNGFVVGIAQNASGLGEAFLWTPEQHSSGLGTLGGFASGAFALSDDGRWWIGSSELSNGNVHAFRGGLAKARASRTAMSPSRPASVKASGGEGYASRNDNVDIDAITGNPRLFANYMACVLDKSPCAPLALDFKRLLPDLLGADCRKCYKQ